MKPLQAFKFALEPNGPQQRLMHRFAGSCRLVFNRALALQKAHVEQGEKKRSDADLCKQLTVWKHEKETLWLAETPAQALQQTLKNVTTLPKTTVPHKPSFAV